jgi:glycosyltransferase involved in cell wall biosynthesis
VSRPRVAVAYSDVTRAGGAEQVCAHALAALSEEEYDLTFLTLREPDLATLGDYYDVTLDPDRIRVRQLGRVPPRLLETVGDWLYTLRQSLFVRLLRGVVDEYDLVVSAEGELPLPGRTLQYVHHPLFAHWLDPDHDPGPVERAYDSLNRRLAGFDREAIVRHALVTNTEWAADRFEAIYGARPSVCPPPIDVSEFEPRPWDDRENGFVVLGRIDPSKRVLECIETVRQLRERGHDVHVHVVGPPSSSNRSYVRHVREAAEAPFVHLEGKLDRDSLVDLLATHRYGLHGCPDETFGIVVAEFAAAGALPFVPAGGGQVEIVRGRDELVYEGVADAVEKIDRVLSNPELDAELRTVVGDVDERFGPERFARIIREAVADELAEGDDSDGSTRAPVAATPGADPTEVGGA